MLANRGVEPERIHQLLVTCIHDLSRRPDSGQSEVWLTSAPMKPSRTFLRCSAATFSMDVREHAGCSLAKSGMLTREQRMKAVPGLIDLGDDTSPNETTRNWVYQALPEITNQPLPNSSADWRSWYTKFGAVRQQEFRQGDSWSVLGNNSQRRDVFLTRSFAQIAMRRCKQSLYRPVET